MRADRLLSIMMYLQARGRMTAQELARELEVSVRTIYRDMDALSAAGVPVYAERGPGGGCALLDSYRTTLTGLTQDEVRALFLLGIPAPLAELGLDHDLRAAMLKLSAALPASRRGDEERLRQRIHLDPEGWSEPDEVVPHLQIIQQALWAGRKLYLNYRLAFDARAEWLLAPYGLVAKAGAWYLVYARKLSSRHSERSEESRSGTKEILRFAQDDDLAQDGELARDDAIRVLDLSRVLGARLCEESFERPADLDLSSFWRGWCETYQQNRPRYQVSVRVSSDLLPYFAQYFGDAMLQELSEEESPDDEGWYTLSLSFETLEVARARILGFGAAIEVLSPRALRCTVADYAAETVALYARPRQSGLPPALRVGD